MDTRGVTQFFKGIAILLVVFCHSHQMFALPGAMNDILSFLQVGVQLFIILSAFGLCFSYSKKAVSWFGFMKQRVSKLAVFYWLAIVLAAVYRAVFAVVAHNELLKEINPIGMALNALFLHGFVPDAVINNQIVRGGWYVGTIVLLYALFPAMFRIYFKNGKTWEATRKYAFPLIVFAATMAVQLALQKVAVLQPVVQLAAQLAPFALGFPLYELQTTGALSRVRFPLCKGIAFAALACVFYFLETALSCAYVFCAGVAFFYLIASVLNNRTVCAAINQGKNRVLGFFSTMGKYSYAVYLTHSYIAFDFCRVCRAVFSRIYSNDLLWFLLLQPVVVVLAFYAGKVFHKISSGLEKQISNKKAAR